MQNRSRHLAVLLLCLCSLWACGRPERLRPATAPGAITGAAQMRRGGTQAWVPIRPETILYVGDAVQAVEPTEIAFLDGTILAMSEGARVEIQGLDPEAQRLVLQTELGSFELQEAVALIQLAQDHAHVRVETGQVLVTSGQERWQATGGQVLRVNSGEMERIQVVAAAPLTTHTLSPMVMPTASALPTGARMAAFSPMPPTPRTESVAVAGARTATPSPLPSATPPAVVAMPRIQAASTSAATTPSATTPSATTPSATATPLAASSPVAPRPALAIRVNCGGGEYRDSRGRIWSADREYQEGQWGYTGGKVYTTGNDIANTRDDLLYQSERWGDFFYLFDIPNGRYRVTLHFAELYRDDPVVRQFGVRLEGQWVLSHLDLVVIAGRDVAHWESFMVDLGDGQLGIEFIKQLDHPKVNGIEIEAIR